MRTSTPVAVTSMVSSNWAEGFPSEVTAVHYEQSRTVSGKEAENSGVTRRKWGAHVVGPVNVLLVPEADHGLDRKDLFRGG